VKKKKEGQVSFLKKDEIEHIEEEEEEKKK
jgi:hypothetical protein